MGWSQIFLKMSIEGLDASNIGESETAGYVGQIILSDFDWSMTGKDVIKGVGAGRTVTRRVEADVLSLKKRFDSSSVTLMTAMRERKRITTAKVTVAHGFGTGAGAGGSQGDMRDAFTLEVQGGFIENIDVALVADGKAMVLQEELSIRYSSLKIEVFEVNPNGSFSTKRSTFLTEVDGMDLK
ncbi:hypothetical protein EIP75_00595 [Aquabacterium soli]|jgi:type VI protein secretion system component Hcp|uniref:Type VI secretion system secreted protein Hcp n=1 Tax=Aquabacterium soli TaxID=2493092 RepID=A0A3R8TEZ7_9BURK|nr:type VI secretion system tube protein Hcp [Aquabacterium soli]RRS06135.1 hypothetical protein EIP75_00595 [Aquabacterium soli]